MSNCKKVKISLQRSKAQIVSSVKNTKKLQANINPIEIELSDSFAQVVTAKSNPAIRIAKNKGIVTGLTTGLIDLDNLTNGFHPTQLVIIAARPAVGKTAFALNIACSAAKSTRKNIAIFSLEMPALCKNIISVW